MGLLDFFSSKPKPQPKQPTGLLGAAPVITTRQAYNDYVEMCATKGNPALKYEDWVKQQQATPAPK